MKHEETTERELNNVVSLAEYQCPAGSMAMHVEHGMVDVLGLDGWMRCIQIERHVPVPTEEPDELSAERIDFEEVWVHVRELRPADLAKDIKKLRKRGQLMFDSMDT